MADIIINGPEGQSTINNIPAWATAAGQVSVENVLKGMAKETTKTRTILEILARGGKLDKRNQKEVKKEIETLQKVFKNIDKKQEKRDKGSNKTLDDGLKHLQNLQSDGIDQLSKLNKNMNENDKNLDKILNNLNNSSSGLMSMSGGMSKGGFAIGLAIDAITAAAGVFGAVILTAANYVKNEFLDVFKFYNQALSAGTGGIIGLTHPVENVARAANLAGMSLDEFGEFVQSNSKIMRTLGTTGFSNLYSRSLLASNGLLELGMTSEDALGSMMAELEFRRRFGMVIQNQGNQLQSSFTESVRMIRRFSQAAGMSEQELRDGSEVQEEYVDQLRAIGIRLGASGEDIADSTRMISTELKAYGLEDLTNPLFEAISKGSIGLSAETMNLITAFPGLADSIETLSADFQTTGQLPKRAGRELAELLRGLGPDQLEYSSSLFTAGVDGAAAIQNLSKNITKLSDEQFQKFMEDLDTSRFSMLTTFNKLGFIVNQGTATIGDFGKTMLITALGFDEMADETVNFSEGLVNMSTGLKEFVGNTFGRESAIFVAVEQFSDYMSAMFGGRNDGESQAEYEARLDKARTLFVGTISTFAQELGKDLNELLTSGSITTLVSKFFEELMDDMALSINKATGGMLFGSRVQEIYTKQLIRGDLGAGQYNEQAGYRSSPEAREITNQMVASKVQTAFEQSGVTNTLSRYAGREVLSTDITSGSAELVEKIGSDRYIGLINALAGSLYDVDRDFEDDWFELFDFDREAGRTVMKEGLDEDRQKRAKSIQRMMQERYEQAVQLNSEAYKAYSTFVEIAKENNIKIEDAESIDLIGERRGVGTIIDNVVIDADEIGTSNNSGAARFDLEQFMKAYRQNQGSFTVSDFDSMLPILQANLADTIDATLTRSPLVGYTGQEQGVDGAYLFNSIKGKNKSAFFDTNSNAKADITVLNDKLLEYIKEGLTRKESTDLKTMMNTVEKRYGNLTEEDKELLNEMRQLVERVSTLTNEISKTNKLDTSDATSGG